MVRRLTKIVGGAVASVAVVATVLAAVIYGLAARQLAERRNFPDVGASTISAGTGDARRGEHLARAIGCVSCHGQGLAGRVFIEQAMFGLIIAPNLTRIRQEYTDADFVRLLRHATRPDGKGVLPAMPAHGMAHLADEDLSSILAYVRSLPTRPDSLPPTRVALPLRALIVFGILDMPRDLIDHDASRPEAAPADDPLELGGYLARVACSECHGADLTGLREGLLITPHLAIANSYTDEAFLRLMRTGIALGERDLGLMSNVARDRFSNFTDDEIAAIHAYLRHFATASAEE